MQLFILVVQLLCLKLSACASVNKDVYMIENMVISRGGSSNDFD